MNFRNKYGPVKVYSVKGWKDWNLSEPFEETYLFVRKSLIATLAAGKHEDIGKPVHESASGITTTVLGFKKHRCCSILYVLQTNKNTKGVRYLVYGMDGDMNSDYGIGASLSNVTAFGNLDEYYPGGEVAKYVD